MFPSTLRSKYQFDWLMLGTILLLVSIGIIMVLSSSGIFAAKKYGDQYYFFKRQVIFVLIGLIAMYIGYKIPREYLYSIKYPFLIIVVVALLYTIVLGRPFNGAKRWISFVYFTVQPLELAKISLILYLAYFMDAKRELLKTFSRGIIPPFAVTGFLCFLLLLQPDFGGAALLMFLLFFMCLAGGCRYFYLGVSAIFAAGGAVLLVATQPYRFKRFTVFLDPFADAQNAGFQLVQSLYAFGSGGLAGVGLGASKQKLFFLPESYTDFIMSILAEELGFIGMSLVFFIFGMFVWRAFLTTYRQEVLRDKLASFGITMLFTVSAMLNLAVVMGVAPPKGVPMPFISYGGSSLISTLFCAGLLLNYSCTARRAN